MTRKSGVQPLRNDGSDRLLWAATLLAMMAWLVIRVFSLDINEFDTLGEPIQRLVVELNTAAGCE
jgi:hypothetical protein